MVDNASSDGSGDYVKLHFPQVRQIRSEINLAYGLGNNIGADIASGELLLFLNHDTVVTSEFLTELVKVMERHPEIGLAQSKIMMASEPGLIDSIGAYFTWTGMWVHPNHGELDENPSSDPLQVLGTCGASLIVRSTLFDALGGFDPDFLIYFDDLDLAWRARLIGSEAVVVPRSIIYHWGGATTQELPSVFTVFHSFKNRLCSLLKILSVRELVLVLPIHLAICIAGCLAYILRLKPANGLAILRALLWNATSIRGTLDKRRRIFNSSRGDQRKSYKDLIRPLPLSYFLRTSFGYVAKWRH